MPGLITGGYLIRCRTCPAEMVLTEESPARAQDQAVGWRIASDRELLSSNAEGTLCPACCRQLEARRREADLGEPDCECGCESCCEPR